MKLVGGIFVAVTAMTAVGCGGDAATPAASTVTVTSTPVPPTPYQDLNVAWADVDRATAELSPCQNPYQAFDAVCQTAITSALAIIEDIDLKLNSNYVSTRAEIRKEVVELEYWRDVCPSTTAGTQGRRNCIPFMIVPAEFLGITMALHEDNRRTQEN